MRKFTWQIEAKHGVPRVALRLADKEYVLHPDDALTLGGELQQASYRARDDKRRSAPLQGPGAPAGEIDPPGPPGPEVA